MQQPSRIPDLSHLPAPVLTAYLDINPANPRNQRTPRGYVTRLASAGQAMSNRLPDSDRAAFRRQLQRVEAHLRAEQPRGRGLLVVSGEAVWQVVPLQMEVKEEIHWGKPSLQHMLWLLDEHRPRGVVAIDGAGARFFRFWLGSVMEDEAAAFLADTSAWRQKHLVGPSHPGVSKRHGVQRDLVQQRVSTQRRRFARELASRIGRWAEEQAVSPILLAGINEIVDATREALPASMRGRVAVIRKAVPRATVSDIEATLAPALAQWERRYEEALVGDLLEARGTRGVATGLDETLARLQEGRVRTMILARGLAGTLRQCRECGWAGQSADPICARCGGEREARTLRTLLPELASLHGIPVEVVAGRAADELRRAGGIGARLRAATSSSRRDLAAIRSRGGADRDRLPLPR